MRGQDIFIDDDLRKDERSIQAALRQRARTEREKRERLSKSWVPKNHTEWSMGTLGKLRPKNRGTRSSPLKITTKCNPNRFTIATLNVNTLKTEEREEELNIALEDVH